jgi:mRNA-degrading endonuclease RelE of RelBE toxin-antitoxin system
MRRVRYSTTFLEQLDTLLAQGEAKFGPRVIDEKRQLVFDTIDNNLAAYPRRVRDEDIGLCVYAIRKTPFLIAYDFDDAELRVYFVVHAKSDRSKIDPDAVEW